MNYPIWELTYLGGGTLIAVISILHVYISHLAVGGGMFLWLTDRKGFRENSPDIHTYVKKHTWFFLLLTMVFGGMSGVGIWFIISLVHPAATSKLIHAFVFGWAIEWVFFVGEIASLLIYHYFFDTLDRKSRLTIAFLYFLFAWLSLAVINAILSFMLTPGGWLENNNFWTGVLNPTYFSSTVFRTFTCTMIAGLFGYVTALYLKDDGFRTRMIRYCSKWLYISLAGMIVTGFWYFYTVPEHIRQTTFYLNADTGTFVTVLLVTTVLIFIFGLIVSLKLNRGLQKAAVYLLVIIGLGWMGGFEYIREIARKPYIISDFIYSTSIMKDDVDRLDREGVLTEAKWSAVHAVTDDNVMAAGKELFNIQCLSCHTVNGIRNDIVRHVDQFPYFGLMSLLEGQGKINDYMPPFVGTEREKEALASYIVSEIKGQELVKSTYKCEITPVEVEIPKFDTKKDEYVLLAWNDLGMHCISDCDKWFVILPPANTLEAQLIRRGDNLGIITDGVELTYKVQPGFENPAAHVDFWKYCEANFGVKLEDNVGLGGKGLTGTMEVNEDLMSFIAEKIPVAPYSDQNTFLPFPTFTIEARDSATGELLASTKMVAPTSTEMGCRNCHGGDWRFNNQSGVSDETASNILKTHDRLSGTDLYREALAGKPRLCQNCHPDPALGAGGVEGVRTLSAAMHGWHANYMPFAGAEACVACHPASMLGYTRCQRGVHSLAGLSCVNCHGGLTDHALSLLLAETEKDGTARLIKNLHPEAVASVEEINPRTPWLNEPDCLNCHIDFEKPGENPSGFNQWADGFSELYRQRTGDAGIRCEACHNSTHSIYPGINIYGDNLNNMQPMQYMGRPYAIGEGGDGKGCVVCHMTRMDESVHHDFMNRAARVRIK